MSCLIDMLIAEGSNARGWMHKTMFTAKSLHGLVPPFMSQTRHMQHSSRTENDNLDDALDQSIRLRTMR
eukprot:8609455-Pyramimonas_sp.AAC.1